MDIYFSGASPPPNPLLTELSPSSSITIQTYTHMRNVCVGGGVGGRIKALRLLRSAQITRVNPLSRLLKIRECASEKQVDGPRYLLSLRFR